MTLWLLLACSGGWTREAALAPLLTRLDTDGDGRVAEAEYTRVAYVAPTFGSVDADHDGALTASELELMLFRQDPNTFDGALQRTPPDLSLGPGVSGATSVRQRLVWELLIVLREEALSARPDADVPEPWIIQGAAMTERLDSPESREALAALSKAWSSAAGLRFPPALEQLGREAPMGEGPPGIRGLDGGPGGGGPGVGPNHGGPGGGPLPGRESNEAPSGG